MHRLAVGVVRRAVGQFRPGDVRIHIHLMELLRDCGKREHIGGGRQELLRERLPHVGGTGQANQTDRKDNDSFHGTDYIKIRQRVVENPSVPARGG